jgi:hypothetical protein
MIVVPEVIPVTIPVVDPTVTLGLLLVHVPPPIPSVKVIMAPVHTLDGPSIIVGDVLTVIVLVALHPAKV